METSRYHTLDAGSCQSLAAPKVIPPVRHMFQPVQMPVPSFVPAPDAAPQSTDANRLFLAQSPIPAMVQGHGHGGKFGSLVETPVTAFGPTLRFMYGIGFRPFPEGFVRRRHLPWGVAGHLGWQPEPFPQLLVHQRLQLHALRHLPIGKGDGTGMVQRVTVNQRCAPDRFRLLLGQQQLQLAR